MIIVIATIEVAAGQREAFLSEFRRLLTPVRAEAGCLEYAPYIDLETTIPAQDDPRPNVVVVVEKWRDVAALEAHLVAPHMIEYRGQVKHLVKSVSLQVVESAEHDS